MDLVQKRQFMTPWALPLKVAAQVREAMCFCSTLTMEMQFAEKTIIF